MALSLDFQETFFRPELEERRGRLRQAQGLLPQDRGIARLLSEVDDALSRLDNGTYGLCETCHEPVEEERILANPLLRFCLDHLTPDERNALQEDLQTAAGIQRSLLPKPQLGLPGWEIAFHYEPAGPVSGDCCDVFAPEGASGELVFVFGDVAGKGVSAAILMSHLQATFRSLPAQLPVATLVERANRIFRSSSFSRTFATLVCGRVSSTGSLEICNAGHCLPLVRSAGRVHSIAPTGLPLGTFYSSHYGSQKLQLGAGDAVLLYTDGLSETRNETGEEYGTGRIEDILLGGSSLSARDLLMVCLEDCAFYRGRQARADDVSVLVLIRKEL